MAGSCVRSVDARVFLCIPNQKQVAAIKKGVLVLRIILFLSPVPPYLLPRACLTLHASMG